MTFAYDPTLAADKDLVRFHIGDRDDKGHYLEDEEITYFLTSEGSVGGAVVACIKYIILQLSKPDFRQDWMSVTNGEARRGYEMMLKIKAQEFGVSLSGVTVSSTVSLPYRADSYMTSGDQDGAP